MSNPVLMSDLLVRTRKRADQVGNEALKDSPDLQSIIAEVYKGLCAMVSETGHRYFEALQTIPADGSLSYTLNAAHLGTVRMEWLADATSGRTEPLEEISAQQQTYYRGQTGTARKFCLVGAQIFLHPTPPTGTYYLRYIPQPPDLNTYATSDLVDLVVPAGERFLVNGVAAIAKGTFDGDVRFLASERDAAALDVTEWAALRAFAQNPPLMFVEHHADDDWWDL